MILLVSGILMIGSGRKITWAWSPFVFFFFFSLVFLLDSTRTIYHTPHHPNVWKRLSMIDRENVVLNRTVVDSD